MLGPSVVVVASGDAPLLFTPVTVLPDGADDNYVIPVTQTSDTKRKKEQISAFFSAFRGLPDHDLQKWPGGGL